MSNVCLFENGYRDLNNLDIRDGFEKDSAEACMILNNGTVWENFTALAAEAYDCPGIVVSDACKVNFPHLVNLPYVNPN